MRKIVSQVMITRKNRRHERNKMERAKLQEMGLSKEQIDEIMQENGKDIQAAKGASDKLKSDATLNANKVAELQAQLDEINNKNLSEVEKANKDRESAINQVEQLKAQIKSMELRTKLADKGITGENADKLIESLAGGSLDVDLLGEIISARESAAASAKEQEIAKGSTNPNGSKGSGEPEKTDADKLVDSIVSSMSTGKTSQSIIDSYS